MHMCEKQEPVPRPPKPPLRFTNELAKIPEGYRAPLEIRTTTEMIGGRLAGKK